MPNLGLGPARDHEVMKSLQPSRGNADQASVIWDQGFAEESTPCERNLSTKVYHPSGRDVVLGPDPLLGLLGCVGGGYPPPCSNLCEA